MKWIYYFFVSLYGSSVQVFSCWNNKAKLWVQGRNSQKNIWKKEHFPNEWIWVHCASLGEFEQGRPLIEHFKQNTTYNILLTFFSPSGYEKRSNYDKADKVLYLPLDSPRKARVFLDAVQPCCAIFVRYEFWYFYLSELKKRNIPTYLVSASFRPQQLFFQAIVGAWFRKMLSHYEMIFLLDKKSKTLLDKYNILHHQVVGDTRADRVTKIQAEQKKIAWLEQFKGSNKLIIVGSAWASDIEILSSALEENRENVKWLIVPHEVAHHKISTLKKKIESFVTHTSVSLFSDNQRHEENKILILDTIGLLAYAYRYADIVYVGGGFGQGIHNVLEPAVLGKPVLWGTKYKKFPEAIGLLETGGGQVVKSKEDVLQQINILLSNEIKRKEMGYKAAAFVQSLSGATRLVMEYILNKNI